MLSIGDFARLGQVSVRMLRHYDGIGLLEPARVDPATGYRWYDAGQFTRLNRILALKDLGFSLDQVRSMVDGEVSLEELRGMLRLRQAELVAQISEDRDRLDRVARRLHTIESEGKMSENEFVLKQLEPVRVAAVSTTVGSVEEIGGVIGPCFDRLAGSLVEAGTPPVPPSVAFYEVLDDGAMKVNAAFAYGGPAADGFDVVDLPPTDALTTVHHGSMDTVADTWQELVRQAEAQGRRLTGPGREVYLEMPEDPTAWVTELQQPVES